MNRLLLITSVFLSLPATIFAHVDSTWCKDYEDHYCVITYFKGYCKHKCDTYVAGGDLDGHWGYWGDWNTCSHSCGRGSQTRERSCNNPAPKAGGHDCRGSSTETRDCQGAQCPVDGQWGSWVWSPCSVTCGQGAHRLATARCDSPSPAYNGKVCVGGKVTDPLVKEKAEFNSVACGVNTPCPIHGILTQWVDWGECTATCGEGGRQTRTRECVNRANNGRDCAAHLTETRRCNVILCPVHGKYTQWTPWSECLTVQPNCGRGYEYQTRCCTEPEPRFAGKDCAGAGRPMKIRVCYKEPCPLNGQWTKWEAFGDCTLNCGGGTRTRERKCEFPAPRFKGTACDNRGTSSHTDTCNSQACPVNGEWTEWSLWATDTCTPYCKMFIHRCCIKKSADGAPCDGDSWQEQSCNGGEGACPTL